MSQRARPSGFALFLALVTAGLLWGGWKWSEVQHYRIVLARVEAEMDSGLQSLAAKELVELLGRNPRSAEAAFLLGTSEKARGRTEAAVQAWAKVPPDSPFAFRALEGRVELEFERGRLSEAEQLVLRTCQNPQFAGPDPSILLGPIYCREGRVQQAMQVIEAIWRRHNESGEAASETAINQLYLYIQLEANPIPVETIRDVLDQAGRIAPDDDRIWLGKANLALRTNAWEEAARWIDLCLERRPDDVAVWRARLDWAVATNRAPEARNALKHLPTAESTSAEVEKLRAWFAARGGDDETERKSLERLVAADPNDFVAFDRLIDLRIKSGQPDVTTALRQRKGEIAHLQARYRKLVARHQPRRDATEMARLAEQLGRRFEARAFLTIALASARDPASVRRDLDRLAQGSDTFAGSARTLDELLAPQLDAAHKQPGELTCKTIKP